MSTQELPEDCGIRKGRFSNNSDRINPSCVPERTRIYYNICNLPFFSTKARLIENNIKLFELLVDVTYILKSTTAEPDRTALKCCNKTLAPNNFYTTCWLMNNCE